jgi:hypothetical protein
MVEVEVDGGAVVAVDGEGDEPRDGDLPLPEHRPEDEEQQRVGGEPDPVVEMDERVDPASGLRVAVGGQVGQPFNPGIANFR